MRFKLMMAAAMFVGGAMPTVARADVDFMSAESLAPGCRDILEEGHSTSEFVQGLCAGEVSATWTVLQEMNQVCSPAQASANDALIVVLNYALNLPNRRNDRFAILVVEALRKAWSCDSVNG